MNVSTAKMILDTTFKSSFDISNFEYFLTELFNTSRISVKNTTNYVKKEFKEYVNNVFELGNYTDDINESIVFYVVELSKESTRDRARTMQRNLIASLIRNNVNFALVAFYEPNTEDWRFSYVKVGYEFNEEGIKEKLSSPKRHSFLVGPNEPNHTCQKQFLNLLVNEEHLFVKEIENAFNIENVTDEFFSEYKRLFLDLVDSLTEIKEKDEVVNKEFKDKNIKSSDFAKKLMGQLVFIYFLQKKGWLGVDKDDDWSSGPKNFLRKIFDESVKKGNNFFNDVLEPLFYKGLSEEVSDYHFSEFNYKVPFLNGGLFEPINDYDWIKTDIVLDNSIFAEILDTFDKFNFTVKEDEPLDKEVAVDPEMLGKVFENLLEIKDRQSKGAFYTPRPIVHFMCQESLISYLNTNSNINEDDIREFIVKGDIAVNSIIRANEEKKKYNGKQFTKIELPNSIKENSEKLEFLLKKVKIIDPAVGSGAFPVGMMNEIVKARYILRLLNGIENVNMYDLKRETIENSLYGVDLELSATDVTKLRFWLSLIVDEEDIKEIRPLPNLDNQIMCGNSLVDNYEGVRLFDDCLIVRSEQTKLAATPLEDSFNKLEMKKREYFKTNGPTTKLRLRKDINELKWNFIENRLKEERRPDLLEQIRKYKYSYEKPFFVWELEFSEVFKGKNPGFDIAIGNPPYVKEATSREAFDGVRESPYYQGKMDLWYLFGCKSLDLIKDNGIVSFIATNNWVTSFGASKFRNKVNEEAKFDLFFDFGDYKVFDTASIQTMIYIMRKNSSENNYHFNYAKILEDKLSIEEINKLLRSKVSNDNLLKFKASFNRKENANSYFNFIDKDIAIVLDKISNANVTYLDDKELSQGIVAPQEDLNKKNAEELKGIYDTGTGIFVLNEKELKALNLNELEYAQIKPFYTTEQILRYYVNKNNKKWIIYNKSDINENISKFPNIKKHLDKFKKINTSSNKPYGLHRARKEEIFTNEKVIATRKCLIPTFSYADFDVYVSQTFMVMNSERFNLKYLTGILNSSTVQFWLKYKGKMQGNNYQLDKEHLLKIPIILADKEKEMDLINLVESILNLNKELVNQSNQNKERIIETQLELTNKQINQLVYELYGLTDDEIAIIEESIN